MALRTPLYQTQKEMGASFITFGDWELPVSYTDIIREHQKVRSEAGLFDVSHMGEILITGKNALKFVSNLVTNDIEKPADGKVIYALLCYENGGAVDDLLVYKYHDEKILLVINAGNIQKDYEWIKSFESADVEIQNLSDDFVQLALQGPLSESIMKKLLPDSVELPRFFTFIETTIHEMPVLLSRTGYTGEDGFEVYLDTRHEKADPVKLWHAFMEAGAPFGLAPIGLGARDTLRFESALPLYGHELSATISPLEAGLEKYVKFSKDSFIGKESLLAQQGKLMKKLVGFELIGKGVPRHGYPVQQNGIDIGFVTSGSFCPTLKKNMGIALVSLEDGRKLDLEDSIAILIRDKAVEAKVVDLPFYQKKYKK